jgi:hypothetical protein
MSKAPNVWNVKITIEGNPQEQLALYDAYEVFEEYMSVTREYFDALIKYKGLEKRFKIGKGIEEITGPDGKNWTRNAWTLIMAKHTGKMKEITVDQDVPFWILIQRNSDLNGFVVAVGPQLFYEYLKSDSDRESNMRKLLDFIANYREDFKTIVLIPNFFS